MTTEPGSQSTASVPRSRGGVALAVLVGATLVMLQYLGRLSLHTDETAIALNLRSNSPWALLSQPLDYAQMAPPGWLLLEWGAFHLLGSSEYVLRAVPLIASLAALVLAARLAWRASGGIAPALTVLWLGTSWDFLFFGTQVKQYGSDVVVALLLMLLAMRTIDGDARPRLRDGVLGALAVGCSHAGAGGCLREAAPADAQVDLGGRRPAQPAPAFPGMAASGLRDAEPDALDRRHAAASLRARRGPPLALRRPVLRDRSRLRTRLASQRAALVVPPHPVPRRDLPGPPPHIPDRLTWRAGAGQFLRLRHRRHARCIVLTGTDPLFLPVASHRDGGGHG